MAKTNVGQWDVTAASNADINSVDIAEDCSPKGMNNAHREAMRQVALYLNDQRADNTTAGTGAAYTLNLSSTSAVTAYADIHNMVVDFHTVNTSATPTLAVNGIATPPTLKDYNAQALSTGTMQGRHLVSYNSTDFIIVSYDAANTTVTRASLGLDTTDSPQFAGVNVGSTTLTTVTALSTGVLGVEGKRVITSGDNGDVTVQKINLRDYGEVTNALGSVSASTAAIDVTAGNVVTATNGSTTAKTLTFKNPTASDEGCGFSLVLTNGGNSTITWPTAVKWAGGTAPTLTASGDDVLEFFTVDGGTKWNGFTAGLDMST